MFTQALARSLTSHTSRTKEALVDTSRQGNADAVFVELLPWPRPLFSGGLATA
jgi:hypothetical protein